MAGRPKHALEYAALRALSGLFRALPYAGALRTASGLAVALRPAARGRLGEAERRVREVLGPAAEPDEIRRLVRRAWRNTCLNAAELARADGGNPRWAARHLKSDVSHVIGPYLAEGRGAIVALPHAGNWDLAGVLTRASGLPLFSIARRQSNPLTDAWLNRRRAATGMDTLPNDRHLLRRVVHRLKRGEMLAILPDVRLSTPGVQVPFLNGTANLGGGMAWFARAADVPVFPAFVFRQGLDRHVIRVFHPVWPDPALDREADAQRMLRAVLEPLNRAILADPGQYFWFNKRWVLQPLDAPDRGTA